MECKCAFGLWWSFFLVFAGVVMRWLTCERRPHFSFWKNHILIAYFNIKCRGTHYIFNYDIIIGWNFRKKVHSQTSDHVWFFLNLFSKRPREKQNLEKYGSSLPPALSSSTRPSPFVTCCDPSWIFGEAGCRTSFQGPLSALTRI